jgi:L-aspartate oxidase
LNLEIKRCNSLIVGSGVAGLSAALEAANYGNVILLTKSTLDQSSSYWAQGGVAAVIDPSDSFENHQRDTLSAGRGYCDYHAVETLIKEGSRYIRELLEEGMPFEKEGGELLLGMEGGHSKRRVLHANGAATGKALVNFLLSKVKASDRISILENAYVYDLVSDQERSFGALAYLYNSKKVVRIESSATILSTGGYSSLFTQSTNPHTSTGDGLMLALKHGAVLKDLEFVQFHPTVYQGKKGSSFLLTEALRGEGGRLYNERGERFMMEYPNRELSPRDVVSREIFQQISNQKENHVYLDLTHLNTNRIRNRFPGLICRIEAEGINIALDGIPVAPAAHYSIGGIETDINGQTSIKGLYACGEVAAAGVHGANRLASNSLLECLVFSKRAAKHASGLDPIARFRPRRTKPFTYSRNLNEPFSFQKNAVTSMLNKYAGIEREERGLHKALDLINNELKSPIYSQGNEYFFIRMKNMVHIAELILLSALYRKESRGVHYRKDYPEPERLPYSATRFYKNRYDTVQAVS